MSAQAFDDFLRIMRVQLDVEPIDIRKSLEENPLHSIAGLPANALIPGNRG
jgi:hypothetical protein